MITNVCLNEFVNNENIPSSSGDNSEIYNEGSGVGDATNAVMVPQSYTLTTLARPPISPLTPDSQQENGVLLYDLASPVTSSISSPPNLFCFSPGRCNRPTFQDGENSHTPKESVFDPFAPGPDKFMLAPQRRKLAEETKNRVVRRLTFTGALNFSGDLDHESSYITLEEEHLFESLFSTILDAILFEQTKEVVRVPTQVSNPQGFITPKSCLCGIAETCPGAPKKPISRYRRIDKDLCRKLAF